MTNQQIIEDTSEAWDSRALGADEEFVGVAPDINHAVDASLGLTPISIRLPQELLQSLKALAQLHGMGYQPLIRQVLIRWVDGEVKQMLIHRVNELKEEQAAAPQADEDCGPEQQRAAA